MLRLPMAVDRGGGDRRVLKPDWLADHRSGEGMGWADYQRVFRVRSEDDESSHIV